jgi:hypothetical protein
VPRGCRSDDGLSKGIIKRLQDVEWCECHAIALVPANFIESYRVMEHYIQLCKPDLVLCVGDRIEMTAAACAAFHSNIKIAHYYAGIISPDFETFDTINRHCITMWADIAFCESKEAVEVVASIWSILGKNNTVHFYDDNKENFENNRIYNVGISHLDDLEIDESLVPERPYDLALVNPTTKINEQFSVKYSLKRQTIVIGGNPDGVKQKSDYPNLPRSKFLGLLKNCTKFITNSSAAYYEAPYFLKKEQIIMVGIRNKNRVITKDLKLGGSNKIVEVLESLIL